MANTNPEAIKLAKTNAAKAIYRFIHGDNAYPDPEYSFRINQYGDAEFPRLIQAAIEHIGEENEAFKKQFLVLDESNRELRKRVKALEDK